MTRRITDHEITEMMIRYGGGFVARLGELYRHADSDHQRMLKQAFPAYFTDYMSIAIRVYGGDIGGPS